MTPERWNKVKNLTQEAKRKRADDREAYLQALYRADPSLGLDVISLMEPDETASSTQLFRAPGSRQENLAAGDDVGPYKILNLLGQGGMGRVYQAKDPRLGRFVALKFLPEELERDPHIRARFLQEARVAAALDHPFICKIYEIGQYGDRKFIAMEYVEGETLSDKLGRDRPSVSETVRLGIEVADALEKAHQKAVIHRDLKPQNIMLTAEGHIKLMDFGLARRLVPSPDDTANFTASAPGNLLVGTLAYMSPEQFHGEAVDHRSDIFSFGIILYEMLTGTHPFRRPTKLETANAISQDKLSPFPEHSKVPKELERVVAKMLEKEPADRYQAVKEIRRDLIDVQNTLHSDGGDRAGSPARWVFMAVLASVIVLVGLVLFWSTPFREGVSKPLKTVPLTSYPRQERWPCFSPDGKRVVFGWNGGPGNNFDLYLKTLGAEDRTRLTVNSAHEMYPDWSPNGRTIAFARQGARTDRENGLFLVPPDGGPETQLREGNLRDPDWSPDGKQIVFAALTEPPAVSSRILLFSIADLKEQQISFPPSNQSDTNPVFSPDGRLLAFVRWTGQEAGDIHLLDLKTRRVVQLTSRNRAVFGLAWEAEGREIIFASNDGREGRIWRVPVSGGEPAPTEISADILSICLSHDRNLLAYEEGFNELNIWRMPGPRAAGATLTPQRLIASTQEDLNPDYSPDGDKIVFSSRRTGSSEIWMSDAEGQNPAQLTSLGQHSGTPRWSPDGRMIAFDSRPEGHSDILVMDAKSRSRVRLTDHPADDVVPSWSRDGNWIYFGSDRTGKWEVWKVSRDGSETIQVTKNGGWNAAESPDGAFLYYLKAPYSPLWRMPLAGGPETVVINELVFWPNWKLLPEGIFLAKDRSFFLVDYDGRARRLLHTLEREPDWEGPQWLALSPDQRWLLYSSFDHEVRDIMLVEDFR